MAKRTIVTPDSIILDSKNLLTSYTVHLNGGTKILEETVAEIKEITL